MALRVVARRILRAIGPSDDEKTDSRAYYLAFRTDAPGVALPDHLSCRASRICPTWAT